MSVEAYELDLVAPRGMRFVTELEFWEDDADTVPFSTTPYTPTLVISGIATLTLGAGLERTSENKIRVKLTAAQTSMREAAHYYLQFKEGSEDPEAMIKGTITFPAP
jgi:hypothetical protein